MRVQENPSILDKTEEGQRVRAREGGERTGAETVT